MYISQLYLISYSYIAADHLQTCKDLQNLAFLVMSVLHAYRAMGVVVVQPFPTRATLLPQAKQQHHIQARARPNLAASAPRILPF